MKKNCLKNNDFSFENKNHPTSSFQKQELYLLRFQHSTKILIVMLFILPQIFEKNRSKDPYFHYRTMFI